MYSSSFLCEDNNFCVLDYDAFLPPGVEGEGKQASPVSCEHIQGRAAASANTSASVSSSAYNQGNIQADTMEVSA